MLLLFWNGVAQSGPNDTYFVCSSTDPDILDLYVDGTLVGRFTVA